MIPKQESWDSLKRELALDNMDNPLPDTIRVRVDKPDNIPAVYNSIKNISGECGKKCINKD